MKAHRIGDGILIDKEDGSEKLSVSRTVGAIVWPKDGAPAYACIFGHDTRSHTHRKKPITFLWEHESSVLEDSFFEAVLSTARSLVCNEFFGYNSGPEDYHTGGFNLFRRFMDSRDSHIRISTPRLENWETSLSIIRSWKVGEGRWSPKFGQCAKL